MKDATRTELENFIDEVYETIVSVAQNGIGADTSKLFGVKEKLKMELYNEKEYEEDM